jgi:uncharacterized protein (UPF0128 family)
MFAKPKERLPNLYQRSNLLEQYTMLIKAILSQEKFNEILKQWKNAKNTCDILKGNLAESMPKQPTKSVQCWCLQMFLNLQQ